MADDPQTTGTPGDQGKATDALRNAIERTLAATAPAAQETKTRAEGIVDEISKRGQDAADELARRGQKATEEIARLGHDARAAVSRRRDEAGAELRLQLEAVERRLASIEERLVRRERAESAADAPDANKTKPEAEV